MSRTPRLPKFEIPQETLFDDQAPALSIEEASNLSIEEVAERVRIRREQATYVDLAVQGHANPITETAATDQESTQPNLPKHKRSASRKGGAFGGALRRRLDNTEISAEATFEDRDLTALTPLTLQRELFTDTGDQVYRGVVFTPEEFGAITFAPKTFAQRVGNLVLKGTKGRDPSARLARKDEVIKSRLENQLGLVNTCLANLTVDEDVFNALGKEMKSPGYAHMGQEDMDALVAHSEGVYVSMFEAILTNRGVGTERVKNLTAAMYHLLENPDYKKAFTYRRHLTTIGIDWTRNKINRLTEVRDQVQNELNERFGQSA